ncbi:MAG: GrdX family protein [Thermovirgaceae bacterium]|nr:GrdX family protein [Synergistales bacterium]
MLEGSKNLPRSRIITNNPLVIERFKESIPVEGGPAEVFKEALQHLEKGAVLSGHPLSGSIRLTANPYRSIVVDAPEGAALDRNGVAALLDAIDRVERASRERIAPQECLEDYAFIDLDLLKAGISDDPEKKV